MVLILIGHKSPIFVNRVQKENLTGSHKGYHLYDPNRKKVIHSRDVVFNETSVPGVQKEHKETHQKFVELNVEEESVPALDLLPEQIIEMDRPAEEAVTRNPIPDPVSRRSTRNWQEPDRYGYKLAFTATSEQNDPSTVAEALIQP